MNHRYCGRDFSENEIAEIRRLIAEDPSRTRAELSRLTCQVLAGYKTDGELKDLSTRVPCCACTRTDLSRFHHRVTSHPMPPSLSPRKLLPGNRYAGPSVPLHRSAYNGFKTSPIRACGTSTPTRPLSRP
jgi:hypothetical protein